MPGTNPPFRDRSSGTAFSRPLLLGHLPLVILLILTIVAAVSLIERMGLSAAALDGNGNAGRLTPPIAFRPAGADQRARPGAVGAGTVLSPTAYLPIVFSPPPDLKELITEVTVALPHPLAEATGSFCTWGGCSLSPRLYHEPLADGRTFVGWTDSDGNGHVSVLSGNAIERTFDFPAEPVRGLVVHSDGAFAVLLWHPDSDVIYLSKRKANGDAIWTTNLNSTIAVADFWLGDSRLAYGNGLYIAYFTVRGVVGGSTGHYGDQLTYVDDGGHIQPGGWDWGCSHSLAQLVGYHPDLDQFMSICSSDCYPGKGIFANDNQVYQADGNCGGSASAQLGQIALGERSWKLVFNALDKPCCDGRGIGLATIDENDHSSFKWLTNTNGGYERDPVIARLGPGLPASRYLVGWTTVNDDTYWLAVINGEGNFVAGPENVTSAGARWGNRDDSFRTRTDGSVSWVQGEPASTGLHLFRFDGSAYLP